MTSQIDVTKPVFGTPTTQSVRDNFRTAANEITALQVSTTGAPFLPEAGGRMSGPMWLYNDPTDAMQPATKGYVDAGGAGAGGGIPEAPADTGYYARHQGSWQPVVPMAGGTMSGLLILSGPPSAANGAATKDYVDTIAATIPPPAPTDGRTYGRSNAAWVPVLPLAGNANLAGSLGVNVAIPTTPAPVTAGLYTATVNATTEFDLNCYASSASVWNYLAAGSAARLRLPSIGTAALAVATTGSAGGAVTFGPALTLDYKGSMTFGGVVAIPTDAQQSTFYGPCVTASQDFTINCYLGAGPVWKYLTSNYASIIFIDSNGALNINLFQAGSNGTTLAGTARTLTLAQSGLLTNTNGGIQAGNGRLLAAGAGNQPSVTCWDTSHGSAVGLFSELNTGRACIGAMDGNGNALQSWVNIDASSANFGGTLNAPGRIQSFNGRFLSSNANTIPAYACWDTSSGIAAGMFVPQGATPQLGFGATDSTGAPLNTWMTINYQGNLYLSGVYSSVGVFPSAGDNAGNCGMPGTAWFQVAAYNHVQSSDPAAKRDIAAVTDTDTLDKIAALDPIRFRWKDAPDDAPVHWGFSAPDVAAVMDRTFGGYVKDETTGVEGLQYADLVAVLWRGVQLLAARVETLEGKRRR